MNYRALRRENSNLKSVIFFMGSIIFLMTVFIVKLADDREYYMHEYYAESNSCQWEWDVTGAYTVCK